MPVMDGSVERYSLDDFLTSQVPVFTDPFWAGDDSEGVALLHYLWSYNGTFNYYLRTLQPTAYQSDVPDLGIRPRAMFGFGGTGKPSPFAGVLSGSFVFANWNETQYNAQVAAIDARVSLLGLGGGGWTPFESPSVWPAAGSVNGMEHWFRSGPVIHRHLLDVNDKTSDTAMLALYNAMTTTGSGGWSRNPRTAWKTDVDAVLQNGLANSGWKFVKPWQSLPKIRPINRLTTDTVTSYASEIPISTSSLGAVTAEPGVLHFPRTSEGAMAWLKEIQIRTSSEWDVTRPNVIQGGSGLYYGNPEYSPASDVVAPIVPAAADVGAVYHFSNPEGDWSPTSQPQAVSELGVTYGSSWTSYTLYGVPGLVAATMNSAFRWQGVIGASPSQPLRITVASIPVNDFNPPSMSNLDEFLAYDGVTLEGQWELWPQSIFSPALPPEYRVNVEKLTVDLSMAGGVRLGVRPTSRAGIDGGEIT